MKKTQYLLGKGGIVISILPLMLFIFSFSPHAMAQDTNSVSGTVTSVDDGMPLPGATITVLGKSNGATSDFDGNYILDNVEPDAILAVSYIGFVTTEFSVEGKSTIDLALQVNTEQLDEVRVWQYEKEGSYKGCG